MNQAPTRVEAGPNRDAPERVPTRPTLAEALAAIRRRTTSQTWLGAVVLLLWLANLVRKARKSGYVVRYLNGFERAMFHQPMSMLIPDRTVAEVGSDREIVELYLLDPAKGELGF